MENKKKRFSRYTALGIIVLIIFTSIISRLAYLQVFNSQEYKDEAYNKSTRGIQNFAPRGDIEDKNGVKLAVSDQSYMLTFTETDESDLNFYTTMDKVFKLLDDNGETQKDDMELKINPFRFEFQTEDDSAKKQLELRFKKDRGLDSALSKKMFSDKKDSKLTDSEQKKLDSKLLTITPEATFNYLIDFYRIAPKQIFEDIVSKYSSDSDGVLKAIQKDYKVSVSTAEISNLLKKYAKDKKSADKKDDLNKLEEICGVDKIKFSVDQERRYMLVKDAIKKQSFSGYKPIVISSNIKRDTAFKFMQELDDLPGIDITVQPLREYPFGQLASSVLGYISKIPQTNPEKYEEKGYDVDTDYVGISGIEAAFEDRLKGAKGETMVKINNQGRPIEELGSMLSYPGQTIKLTIDSNVQYATDKALDETMAQLQKQGGSNDINTSNATRAAAVAVDMKGDVIAMSSRPGFDPNDFANPEGLSKDQFNKYFNQDLASYGKSRGLSDAMIDKLFPVSSKTNKRYDAYDFVPKPLYNYAASLNPPGSTFKPITAIAGLESGVIDTGTIVDDEANFSAGGTIPPIWFLSDGPNGPVNLNLAIAKSSNPYFMTVGQKLLQAHKGDALAEYAWKFGLGVKPNSNVKPSTGIEIPELFGQVSNAWSLKNTWSTQTLWSVMNMLCSGKGQSYLTLRNNSFTPIDLHDDDHDSADVKKQKNDIKDLIKNYVVNNTEKIDANKITDMLSGWINIDPKYKGKSISSSEYKSMVQDIIYIIYTGRGQSTTVGEMYNACIGQGISQFTPLQLANYVATLANGGTRYKLHLLDSVVDPSSGAVIQKQAPEVAEKTGVSQSILDAVKGGMLAVNDKGTAQGVFDGFPIQTAGKTGTATYSNQQHDYDREAYGVYVGFAPFKDPQIAVAIVIYDGGAGRYAAPVARAMYEAYFKKELDSWGYTPTNDVVAKPEH